MEPSSYPRGNPYAASSGAGVSRPAPGGAKTAGVIGTSRSSSSTARSPGSVTPPRQPPWTATPAVSSPRSGRCGKLTVTAAVPLAATTWAQVTTWRAETRKPEPTAFPHWIRVCQAALFIGGRWPHGPSPAPS